MKLTPRQHDTLEAIRVYIAKHGFSPSMREICDALGVASTNSAHEHLSALEDKGYITRLPGKARTVRIVKGAA